MSMRPPFARRAPAGFLHEAGPARLLLVLALAALVAASAPAQDPAPDPAPVRPLAILVKRAIGVAGAPIDDATILIEDGKISAIGARDSVDVPSEADVIDGSALWATPGFIHPASLAMTPAGNYETSGKNNNADKLAAEDLVPTWPGVRSLAAAGFTRVNVIVSKGGIAGQSVVIRPLKKLNRPIRPDDVVATRDLALCMGFEPRTTNKAFWTETLAKAKKYRDDSAAASKGADKSDAKAESAPASGEGGAESKPAGDSRPASGSKGPAADPKVTPLADLFDSKMPGILDLASAAAVLHFLPLVKDYPEFKPALLLRGGDSWRVVEQVKGLGVPVILTTDRVARPDTSIELVPARDFVDAGVAIALIPETSFATGYEGFVFHLAELVRKGVPRDQVLRAVTLTPAEILGIQKEAGSLEKGKAGDLLLWSADPLSPEAALVRVIVGGTTVFDVKENP